MHDFRSLLNEYRSLAFYFLSDEWSRQIDEYWDFTRICEPDFQRLFRESQISETAYVGKLATLIDPVIIGPNAKVLNGSYVEGPVVIGDNSTIGPNCYIRPRTVIANDVRIGYGVEIKESFINSYVSIAHLSYIGHSIVGKETMVGAGVIVATRRLDGKCIVLRLQCRSIDTGLKKLGALIGDRVQIGIGVLIMPGQVITSGTVIPPGAVVGLDVKGSEHSS